MARKPPHEADEVVQRVVCQYQKTGRMRFSSHRDFQRSIERALRRVGAPVAFSGGFSPRPRISYANSAPTGVASEAEYIEIGLTREVSGSGLAQELTDALPTGLAIVRVQPTKPGFRLAEQLTGSHWQFQVPGEVAQGWRAASDEIAAGAKTQVTRTTKSGPKVIDVGASWARHWWLEEQSSSPTDAKCAILNVVVRHQEPATRPDDVLTALIERTDLKPPKPVLIVRLWQGPLDETSRQLGDPLAQLGIER